MAHSALFAQLERAVRIADRCEQRRLSTQQGLEEEAARRERAGRAVIDRRRFLQALGAAALVPLSEGAARARAASSARVVIIGGGLAGMVCADRLAQAGVAATIYEANTRLGGRCHSYRGFPGQVVDRGGEMIDTAHRTMLRYAREFHLELEDMNKQPGEATYFFNGQRCREAEVVDEWRALVPRLRRDVQRLSSAPSAQHHTLEDIELDNTDLQTYLDSRCAGLPLIHKVLTASYVAEYGREPHEQSCLNLLLFVSLNRRGKFYPYDHQSDERYHLVGGNDQIISRIRARLPGPVYTGAALERLSKNGQGRYEVKLAGASQAELADAVVITAPFAALRGGAVELDGSLGIPAAQRAAIEQLGYGYNGKTFVAFRGRPWAASGGNGEVYADLPSLQYTWESNWTRAAGSTVMTDYIGGDRGRALQVLGPGFYCGACHPPSFFPVQDPLIQAQVAPFLMDLDRVFPGAAAAALRNPAGGYVLHRAHWLPQRFSKGSYTCYLRGQFTTIAGLEGQQVQGLYFAGEHADSFYEWQGFLEGAARSGEAAAEAILADMKAGRL